jgi:hypothetical protein
VADFKRCERGRQLLRRINFYDLLQVIHPLLSLKKGDSESLPRYSLEHEVKEQRKGSWWFKEVGQGTYARLSRIVATKVTRARATRLVSCLSGSGKTRDISLQLATKSRRKRTS